MVCDGLGGTFRTFQICVWFQALICSKSCSSIEHSERKGVGLALCASFRLPLAAMPSLRSPRPNKLLPGYPAECVFGGRGVAGWGNRAAAGSAAAGRSGLAVLPGCGLDHQAGRGSSRSASIMQNQGLSGAHLKQVAPATSHQLGTMADFCGFGVPACQITSFATVAAMWSTSSRAAAVGAAIGGGVPPLLVASSVPYAGRAGQTHNLQKTGLADPATTPKRRYHAGCNQRVQPGAKVSYTGMGSGVRGSARRILAGERARGAKARENHRVRVSGEHEASCLARTSKLGGGAA